MTSIILSLGDELVLGQTIDTNSAWLSQQLASVGCDVIAHATLPDNQLAIENAIKCFAARCDYLIISGGIGPTEDDLTRQALASVLNVPLELNEKWLAHLHDFFESLGRPMPPTNQIQAMIPRGTTMIENTAGTAAGIDASFQTGDLKQTCRIFVVPGVPKEMKVMFARDIFPHIQKAGAGACIVSRTLHTFGLGESAVAEKLGALMKRDRNPSVGTTVDNGIVSIRINARYPSRDDACSELEATTVACREALGDLIFGTDDNTLESVVAKQLLGTTKIPTVTTAESCTGGLLAKMLTDVPGSSAYFKQAWVTYSNGAKRERLGVSENIINVHGAVSKPVVEAMAANARRLAKADFALAISGIAGPDGGIATKPVGTVCIALASAKLPASAGGPRNLDSDVVSRTFHFHGDREMIRYRAAKMALTMLRFHLLDKPMPF